MKVLNWLLVLCLTTLMVDKAWAGSYLDKGNQYFSTGHYPKAYLEYKKALQNKENPTISQFNMANCLFKMNQVGRALSLYNKLIREYPKFIRPYINAGGVYYQMDRLGEALIYYEKAHALDTSNITAIKMLGETWLKLHNRVKALEYFEKGKIQEPKEINWVYGIVDVYLGLEDFTLAEWTIGDALKDFPNRAELYFYLGDLQVQQKKNDEALLNYSKGLALDPENSGYYYKLADLQEKEEQYFTSIFTIESGIKKKALDLDAYFEIARLYQLMNNSEKAVENFILGYANDPDFALDSILYILEEMQKNHQYNTVAKIRSMLKEANIESSLFASGL